MSTVPEPRDSREVEPAPGTLGAFLAFVKTYNVSPHALLCVWDAEIDMARPWDRIDYKVSTDVADEIVIYQ